MVSHCGFNLHLSDGQWCRSSFHMSPDPLYVLLGEVSVQVFCTFFNWVVCLPGAEMCGCLYILELKPLPKVSLASTSSHIIWFSFHFNAVFFSCAEVFYFDEIPFVYSSLYVPCSRDISVKILLCGISEIFLPMFSSRTSMVLQLIFKFLSTLNLFLCMLRDKYHMISPLTGT